MMPITMATTRMGTRRARGICTARRGAARAARLVVELARVELVAGAEPRAAGAAAALACGGLRAPDLEQVRHAARRVVAELLDAAGVDNVRDLAEG